ncbi:MAG: tetratricopeptide repeat protein [Planctomycetota bacterium]
MSRPPLQVRIGLWLAQSANSLGDGWNRLVEPFEGFFHWVGESVFGAFDSFEELESRVVRGVATLFWPLVVAARWVGRFLPKPAPDSLFATLPARVFDALVGGAMWFAEKLNLDRVLLFLVWLLTPLWWPVLTAIGFLNAWINTRNPREMVLCVPALLLAAPFAYVAIAGTSQSQGEIADRYKLAVRDALESGDHARVFLFERKLAQLGVDTRRADYRNAAALADDGDLPAAYERMKRLAPVDRPGYPSAHAWIAQRLIAGELTEEHEPTLAVSDAEADAADPRFPLADKHLGHLEELGAAGPQVTRLRALSLAGQGRFAPAAELLAPVAASNRVAAALRLRWLLAARSPDLAKEQAADLLELYAQQAGRETPTSRDCQIRAMAADLVRDDAALEAALADWRTAEPDSTEPRRLLAALRQRQVDRLLATRTATSGAIIDRLCEAAEFGSQRAWITQRVQLIYRRSQQSVASRRTWELLLATPNANPDLREPLGAVAAAGGEIVAARRVLGTLIDEGVDRPVVWNNYAWALNQQPEPDAAAALRAADRALLLKPDDPRFRETRGQVLITLGRWREAVEELEFALNRMPDSPNIHRSLAAAYDALEQPQLARSHREQANR